ncbi:hypothetical protein C5B42_02700 [Candidatus Cerribacteria bacterium 'Amazon FNV 2010 28 9']|uniref:PhnB-like domain-containing protein n=1 Tax=Candidatus Cerribacteria bacterium 'Amazon FNV 2010 28 9' TaxID=2081795 RepID=A0A317JP01_9BACT|nr:MAG: hypothetical protein C5B42_02700 [Candidatus Cerribacteria bacterium 'Amazon FNV 2010 28 9']
MTTTLIPYLNFPSQSKAAMEFYHSVFGGKLTMQTFGESGMKVSEQEKDLVIHAELKTDLFTIMASDGGVMHAVTMGNNINMSLIGTDEVQLRGFFEKLSEGGKIDMKLEKQFWGDMYGRLTDKFGVHWMVNISAQK